MSIVLENITLQDDYEGNVKVCTELTFILFRGSNQSGVKINPTQKLER